MSLDLSFLPSLALAMWALVWFHMNFRIVFSSSVKNDGGVLMEIALNLQITFGNMVIFTILILPNHEHGMFLHLFVVLSYFLEQWFLVVLEEILCEMYS